MVRIIKRLAEIALAFLGLVLLAPVSMFIALAIYSVDGRPVLIPEVWVDRHGRAATLLAFRTNRMSLASHGNPHWDPTPLPWVGQYLRRGGLEKLPRLWCLLRGDCNLDALWF